VSSLSGNRDGTTYCNFLTPSSFSFRDAGTSDEILIGSVSVTSTTAEISFEPDQSQIGSHSLDLYAILDGVYQLLFSNIDVTIDIIIEAPEVVVSCDQTEFIDLDEELVI
jgi:hypothetical protein